MASIHNIIATNMYTHIPISYPDTFALYISIFAYVFSPFKLSTGLTKHPILATNGDDAIFQLAFPFILCAMDLFVHAQDDGLVCALSLSLLALAKLAVKIGLDVAIVEITVDGIVEGIDFLFGFALWGVG